MPELFASLEGRRVTGARVLVPNVGSWFADCDLDERVELAGRVTLQIGPLTLSGTVSDSFSGSFGEATKIRIVAGANGWSKEVAAKAYHNDAGVKAATVLGDAARAVGETITGAPDTRLGADFVRVAGPASRVLSQVLYGGPWWLDYEGVTHFEERPTQEVAGAVDLLTFDQREQVITLATDDPRAVRVGTILRERLDAPETARAIELIMSAGKLRILAWSGGAPGSPSRIVRALRAVARETTEPVTKFHGLYRYRVVRMSGDRVELQAVRKLAGLPDVLPVSLFAGMAGLWAKLAPSSLVLVTFIEGDPTAPILTHYTPKDHPGFVPVELLLDASTRLDLGPSSATVRIAAGILPAARQTDPVQCGPFIGTITAGSPKVTVG